MEFINEWIINIIMILLLAMIIDLLLPESNMKKYVKLVTGLLLIAIIISPVFTLMSTDFNEVLASINSQYDQNELLQENLLETKKSEIQANQHAYILEQMAVQMKKEVEKELMDQFGVLIERIEVTAELDRTLEDGMPDQINVYLVESQSEVKTVEINVNKNKEIEFNTDQSGILTLLSKRWDVPVSKIDIIFEGRDR